MKEIEDGSIQFEDKENNLTYVYRKPTEEQIERVKKEKPFIFDPEWVCKTDFSEDKVN